MKHIPRINCQTSTETNLAIGCRQGRPTLLLDIFHNCRDTQRTACYTQEHIRVDDVAHDVLHKKVVDCEQVAFPENSRGCAAPAADGARRP
eukprot:6209848-Pleurochrysis_carterae.AAC.1